MPRILSRFTFYTSSKIIATLYGCITKNRSTKLFLRPGFNAASTDELSLQRQSNFTNNFHNKNNISIQSTIFILSPTALNTTKYTIINSPGQSLRLISPKAFFSTPRTLSPHFSRKAIIGKLRFGHYLFSQHPRHVLVAKENNNTHIAADTYESQLPNKV